jgi:hypothetical protein
MQRPRVRFKAWTLLVAVGIVAVSLAAARVESAPGAGIAIIGSCISYLAYKRYSEAVALRRSGGLTTSRLQKAVLLLASATAAATVIGLSDIGFLAGYYGYLKVIDETVWMSHWTPYNDAKFMGTGVVIGVMLALGVASSLRRTLLADDRAVSGRPRRWLKLWPIMVTVLILLALGLENWRERWQFCAMMADYHAGPEARADGPKKAALHAWLKRWYEKAAVRPWLPIDPDHIPPEL